MLSYGERRVVQEGLQSRITLVHGYLPDAQLPCMQYDAVISNSLLHHLRDPAALWRTLRACVRADAPVFVMDLLRPEGRAEAEALVEQYAANEPAVQRHDFQHSFLAASRQGIQHNVVRGILSPYAPRDFVTAHARHAEIERRRGRRGGRGGRE